MSKYASSRIKELLIKDLKTTYLHLPEKSMIYASERSCIVDDNGGICWLLLLDHGAEVNHFAFFLLVWEIEDKI